eukprot:1796903-Rhodomonas_salina.3
MLTLTTRSDGHWHAGGLALQQEIARDITVFEIQFLICEEIWAVFDFGGRGWSRGLRPVCTRRRGKRSRHPWTRAPGPPASSTLARSNTNNHTMRTKHAGPWVFERSQDKDIAITSSSQFAIAADLVADEHGERSSDPKVLLLQVAPEEDCAQGQRKHRRAPCDRTHDQLLRHCHQFHCHNGPKLVWSLIWCTLSSLSPSYARMSLREERSLCTSSTWHSHLLAEHVFNLSLRHPRCSTSTRRSRYQAQAPSRYH